MSRTPASVLFGTPLWGRDGGVAAHVAASATLLAKHGLRVAVLAAHVDAGEPAPGVTVFRSPELFKTDAPMQARLGEALSFNPDVIHLHQLDDPDVLRALRATAPVVVSAHAYTACTSSVHYFRPGHECQRPHGPACVPNLIARGCAHVRNPQPLPASYRQATRGLDALRHADLAISYSSAIDRHLAINGVTRRAIVALFTTMTARPGPEPASPEPASLMQPSDAERGAGNRVLFAGRVVRPKGLGVLIRAVREVDAELVVCGDGFQLNAMRRLAQRLDLERRITFTGWLGAERLAAELADAAVVVVPSLWPEPFGLVGIEALAAGRAVIASSTGGIGDWLHDGVTGLSVPPGDVRALARALRELLSDPERRRALGSAGRELVATRFSPERHIETTLDAYAQARSAWLSGTPSRLAA
jgi:glycosyltransferase involved in cell wall biosynthesis